MCQPGRDYSALFAQQFKYSAREGLPKSLRPNRLRRPAPPLQPAAAQVQLAPAAPALGQGQPPAAAAAVQVG